MNEDMEIVVQTEKTLYWGIVVLGVLNCLGLSGAVPADVFILSVSTIVLVAMGISGLSRLKSDLPIERRHRYIFSTSYMALSLGISQALLMISPYSLAQGLIVPALIVACGWVAIGIYSIAREAILSRVVDWM